MPLEKIIFILEYFEKEYGIDGWVTNLRTEETAQDRIDHGFFADEVWKYLEAVAQFHV